MKRYFWYPFLIFAGALILLAAFSHYIPAWDNNLFPIKKLNVPDRLANTFKPAAPDTMSALATKLHVTSTIGPMESFREQLNSLGKVRTGNIRIAYFGDSIIEGDLISGKLRSLMQSEYGGEGVGLVPITSIVNEFRRTVKHRFSRNWETLSLMKRGGSSTPIGMIGYTFIPRNYYYAESIVETNPSPEPPPVSDSLSAPADTSPPPPKQTISTKYYLDGPAWVEYIGTQFPGGSTTFGRIRLFYSRANQNSYVNVSFDGGALQKFQLDSGDGVQVLELTQSTPVAKIRLEFNPYDPLWIYGVSLDETNGVYVDNLSVRGFSGMYLEAIPSEVMRAFHANLGYDLVILQYGGNVSSPQTRDYGYYKRGMLSTVKHIQATLPGVPILIVSVQDRSVKLNGSYQTSPDIPILVNTQGEVAKETGSAFWNLFEAMGGLNSMPSYVNARPQLAGYDYTHFTIAGANHIADLLHKFILSGKLH